MSPILEMEHPLATDPAAHLPTEVLESLAFERSQWAFGSVYVDPFYELPESYDIDSISPGTPIKLEQHTDTSAYSLPPGLALSRLIYQSTTIDSNTVPTSAYILWPFSPRTHRKSSSTSISYSYDLVAWTHGTSGQTPNAAPSHIKNLWQHYMGPFALALAGFVVVAPDYAGLGVPFTSSNPATRKAITHHYLFSPEHALDTFHAVAAARKAFPEKLGKSKFVVTGHSQGGSAAWACAALQRKQPMEGYLGAVSISPVTGLLDPKTGNLRQVSQEVAEMILPILMAGVRDMYGAEGFKVGDVLTPAGVKVLEQLQRLGGCSATNAALVGHAMAKAEKPGLTREGWERNKFFRNFDRESYLSGLPILGPLLVVQGSADPSILCDVTTRAVKETAENNPEESVKYVVLEGVSHNPACTAAQHLWINWIRERFEGVEVQKGLGESTIKPVMGPGSTEPELNWWIAPAERSFHAP